MLYSIFVLVALGVLVLWLFARRPKLDPSAQPSLVPDNLTPVELDDWLKQSESQIEGIVSGAEAWIEFADNKRPAKTETCFLYIHGFSASRQETAPVTSMIAAHHNANVFHARLAGHGVGSAGMTSTAESWLKSMVDAWKISEQLGKNIVIVATSTGAPLTVWLLGQPGVAEKTSAVLMMAPNFKIKNPFGFLLTWPLSPHWVHLLLGKTHSWEAESPLHAQVWTSSYSTLAVIEMQKTVDWVKNAELNKIKTPLAMMCMQNDPTVSSDAAINAFNLWGASIKSNIPIKQDSESAEHVFTGDLAGAHRTEETVEAFINFLKPILG